MKMKEIQEAVTRGWCSPENEKKGMDVALATAISVEIMKLFIADKAADKVPKLGCATTGQLLAEIKARIALDCKLDYRTIDIDKVAEQVEPETVCADDPTPEQKKKMAERLRWAGRGR